MNMETEREVDAPGFGHNSKDCNLPQTREALRKLLKERGKGKQFQGKAIKLWWKKECGVDVQKASEDQQS